MYKLVSRCVAGLERNRDGMFVKDSSEFFRHSGYIQDDYILPHVRFLSGFYCCLCLSFETLPFSVLMTIEQRKSIILQLSLEHEGGKSSTKDFSSR